MNRKRIGIAAAALALALACARSAFAWGVPDQGTSGAQFLKLSPGARAASMGDAGAAVSEDVYAAYFNPAGLGFLREVQAAAMRSQHFQGITHNFGAVATPLLSWMDSRRARNEFGAAAFALTSLSVDGLERRGVVETDDPTDTFGARDFAYTLAYGLPLSKRWAAGAALKVLDQSIDSSHATAFGLDLGGLWHRDRLSFGGGIRNLGTEVKFGNEADPLPLVIYGGGGYKLSEEWLLAADLRLPRDQRIGLSLGAEHRRKIAEDLRAAVRGGYDFSKTDAEGVTGIAFGAGISYRRLEFDFAWAPYGDLGSTFRYSLLVRF
ncbi:MAG: PorV/PorQ family protein [Elusimicrobia bacterium]|nr:PorV/PorQ family protein [Elusimicrobiota bacterium]